MKKTFLIFSFVSIFFLFTNAALAKHYANVTFSDYTWEIGEAKSVDLIVLNQKDSQDNIVKVELTVPLDEKNVSIYKVRNEVILPSGWEYAASIKEGELYMLSFFSIDKGLSPGSSVKFTIKEVKSPDKPGERIWTWKTIDTKEEISAEFLITTTKLGNLDYFVVSEVPNETAAGEPFEVKIIAVETHNMKKTNYVGKIVLSSTDESALFEPKEYTFSESDNGTKVIIVTYNTQGNQTFSVKDTETGITSISLPTLVKPPIPRDLSILINNGAPSTSSTEVELILSAKRAEECKYSNDKIFWTSYEKYSTSKKWILPAGDGTKTIYYQCKNSAGESEIVSGTIELKTLSTLPTVLLTGLFGFSMQTIISGISLLIALLALFIALKVRIKPRKKELT